MSPLNITFYSSISIIWLTIPFLGVFMSLMNEKLYNLDAFGEILKSARISKGLTRKEAAEGLDISPKTLIKYELLGVTDEGQSPSLPRLTRMITLYEIDPRYLFSSLMDNKRDQGDVLKGAHLAIQKTEPFMIEQLGCLSDAVTDEIDVLDDNIEYHFDFMSRPEVKKEYGNTQHIKRRARAWDKRREMLLSELKNIEDISIFSIDPEVIGPYHGSVLGQKALNKMYEEEREAEEISLDTSSSTSKTPQSRTNQRKGKS